jgi:hypothetical protein
MLLFGGYRVYTFLASGTITWGGAAEVMVLTVDC